jgi:endoglucanase
MIHMKRFVACVSLVLLMAGCADAPKPAAPSLPVAIAVNQIGYLPTAPKVATVMVAKGGKGMPGPAFTVVKADGGAAVLSGTLTGPVEEPESSGGPTWLADFSALKTEGTYKVHIENGGESAPFRIAAAVYADVFRLSMRSYDLQRCGAPLDDAATGLKHAACHLETSVLEENRTVRVDTAGGWHDAGDYGKYIPSAAVTVGQLLMLNEFFPAAGKAALGNTTLVDEVRYELEWMLKMQRADGAVYHKVTTENFPGFIFRRQIRRRCWSTASAPPAQPASPPPRRGAPART